jgi:hypothetical protein
MGRRKDQAQFNMRLSRPLLKQLQSAAKDQDRSLNSEMVHRLEQSFESGGQLTRLTEMVSVLLEQGKQLHAVAYGKRPLLDLAPKADTDPDGGNVIDLMDALRGMLGREPTIEELHAARRRALQVEPSDNEPELPMAPRRKIGE